MRVPFALLAAFLPIAASAQEPVDRADEVPAIVRRLAEPNPIVRYAAVRDLGLIGADAEDAVSALVRRLKDDHHTVRGAAAEALGQIGIGNDEVIAGLTMALGDEDSFVRYAAATSLSKFGSKAQPAVAALVELLRSEVETDREAAAGTLMEMREAADGATDPLEEMLKEPEIVADPVRRVQVAQVLWSVARAPDVPTALTDVLRKGPPEARAAAASALGDVARAVDAVAPTLIAAVGDADPRVRANAARSLAGAGIRAGTGERPHEDEAIEALIAICDDRDDVVRAAAASSLGTFLQHDEPDSVIAALLDLLDDGEATVRSAAARSLIRAAGAYRRTVPAILATIDGSESDVAMVEFLGDAQRHTTPDVVPLLHRAADDATPERAEALFQAIAAGVGIEGRADDAVEYLVSRLKDERATIRRFAADALGSAGPAARGARPALEEATRDPNLQVRIAAADALDTINAQPADED